MYTLTLSMPNLPQGTEVEIDGLGKFANGGTYEITEEMNDLFRKKYATIKSVLDDTGHQQNSIVLGASVVEVFKDHPSITVTAAKSEKVQAPRSNAQAAKPAQANDNEGSEN